MDTRLELYKKAEIQISTITGALSGAVAGVANIGSEKTAENETKIADSAEGALFTGAEVAGFVIESILDFYKDLNENIKEDPWKLPVAGSITIAKKTEWFKGLFD